MAFLYLGGVAFVLGAVVALFAVSTWRRGWLLVWLGGLLALAFVVYEWTRASEDGLACHDCSLFLGRYWQWYLVVFFAAVNWFWWSIGIGIGALARAAAVSHRELREQRGAA